MLASSTIQVERGTYISKYLTWGFCLIPIVPRSKTPLVRWQEFQHRKPTQAELSGWFDSNSCNIGIVCGAISQNLVVLDCDNTELYVSLSDLWLEKFGKKIDEMTPVVQTGGSGYHIYLKVKYIPKLFHPTGQDRNHIPDIQSEGGYVLAPPSIHPSGNLYRMLNPGVDKIFEINSLIQLGIDVPTTREPPSQARQKGEPHWVVKALQGVGEGERDNTCIKLAGYFRNKQPQEITEVILLDFAAKCIPPLDEATARKCVRSAYSYESEAESEAEKQPADDSGLMPKLPEAAWRGLFADYRELVSPTTEAADEYHFATFCQVLGCTLGRYLYVYHATRLYPNFYVSLVGRSGLTRKDTCWSRAGDILSRLHDRQGEDNPIFKMVRGIRSYEGLLDELAGQSKVRLIQVGELLSLLSKARQDSQGNLVPALTELYDCPPRLNPPVRGKPADCREPFVSIIAGTTHAWLHKALTESDVYGGFANRWLYFCGTPKPPKPNPPKVNKDKRDALINNINSVRVWASELQNEGEITISGEAEDIFEGYYTEFYKRCQTEGLIPTLVVRVQDHIFKIALLYAAVEQSPVITGEHLGTAIEVGNYLEASVHEIFKNFGASPVKEAENRIMERLRSSRQPAKQRDVYHDLRLPARDFEGLIASLIKVGLVKRIIQKNRSGRQVIYLQAL